MKFSTVTCNTGAGYLQSLEHCISLLKLTLRESTLEDERDADVSVDLENARTCLTRLKETHEMLSDIFWRMKKLRNLRLDNLSKCPRYWRIEGNEIVEISAGEAKVLGIAEDEDFQAL